MGMNQYHNNYTRYEEDDGEINLRDLMNYILCRWRILIIVAILFGMLLGGYKFLSEYSSLSNIDMVNAQETYHQNLEEYNVRKTNLENQIISLRQSIQEKNTYLNESILMGLDPNTAYKSVLTYYVTDPIEHESMTLDRELKSLSDYTVNSILGSYASLVKNGDILESSQLDRKKIEELVYVQADYQTKLLHITVVGETKKQVQEISEAIEDGIKAATVNLIQTIAMHRIELLSSYIGNDMGTKILIGAVPENKRLGEQQLYQTSVELLQADYYETVANMQDQIQDCNEKLDELKEPAVPIEISMKDLIKDGIIFAILGIIGGMLFATMIFALKFLLSEKLISQNEFCDKYGLWVLAAYRAPRYASTNGFDKLIEHMTKTPEVKDSPEEMYDFAAANILSVFDKSDERKVALVGNSQKEIFANAFSELTRNLGMADVEIISAGNINESASAIRKLDDVDKIILIEQCGVSRKQDIKQEILKLVKMEKDILGVIVL